jgi:hypothetical protein
MANMRVLETLEDAVDAAQNARLAYTDRWVAYFGKSLPDDLANKWWPLTATP